MITELDADVLADSLALVDALIDALVLEMCIRDSRSTASTRRPQRLPAPQIKSLFGTTVKVKVVWSSLITVSVSYTHLDVYKRQLADSLALVEALWDALVLADSLALVEALCDAEVLADSDALRCV